MAEAPTQPFLPFKSVVPSFQHYPHRHAYHNDQIHQRMLSVVAKWVAVTYGCVVARNALKHVFDRQPHRPPPKFPPSANFRRITLSSAAARVAARTQFWHYGRYADSAFNLLLPCSSIRRAASCHQLSTVTETPKPRNPETPKPEIAENA